MGQNAQLTRHWLVISVTPRTTTSSPNTACRAALAEAKSCSWSRPRSRSISRTSRSPSIGGLRELTQQRLLHLAGAVARQPLHHLQALRPVPPGDPAAVEVVLEVCQAEPPARPRDDEGAGPLAEPAIAQPGDRHLGHGLVLGEQRLDLGHRQLLAAAVDHVSGSADDTDEAGLVADGQVAGPVPAVCREPGKVEVGAEPVAGEQA